ncbi:hypothetical protein TSAR_015949 [Trichomalopsis sarcophagae]|uniref:Uncharacterized protein n=1 Tax=Trichomalopsis sarcophagae TaxID=543379 RepID=A0A232F3C4_9HYME|nr:hypothetical protein TSAR_015949 [Trichomalopsis sarcophagae]
MPLGMQQTKLPGAVGQERRVSVRLTHRGNAAAAAGEIPPKSKSIELFHQVSINLFIVVTFHHYAY